MSKVKDALAYSEYGEFDVSENRADYIGGSDIPVILGISTFKRRWDLLLEKAKLQEDTFHGNIYTEYGHKMEPHIRNHINLTYNTEFVPNRVINGDIRCHTDGFNGKCVLEIKTTSTIYPTVDSYKAYLVQLVKYMAENHVENGILAVYERPEDMNPVFDARRLQVFEIHMEDYKNLLDYVNREIDKFRADLERLKENPLLSETDFLPVGNDIIRLSDKVVMFEKQLAQLKEIEQKCKEAKKALFNEMVKHGQKSLVTPNGTKITRVDDVPAGVKMVTEFDTDAFKADCPGIYQKYVRQVEKKVNGKSGYVRITVG